MPIAKWSEFSTPEPNGNFWARISLSWIKPKSWPFIRIFQARQTFTLFYSIFYPNMQLQCSSPLKARKVLLHLRMGGIHQGTASAFHQGKRTTKLPQENVCSPTHLSWPNELQYYPWTKHTENTPPISVLPAALTSTWIGAGPNTKQCMLALCALYPLLTEAWTHNTKGRPNCSRQNTPLGGKHETVFRWNEVQDDRGFGHECVQTRPEKMQWPQLLFLHPDFAGLCSAIILFHPKHMWKDDRFYPWAVQALQTSVR